MPTNLQNKKDKISISQPSLHFLQNQGQLNNKDIFYYSHKQNNTYFFEKNTISHSMIYSCNEKEQSSNEANGVTLKISFIDPNSEIKLEPFEKEKGKINYFIGKDPSKWHTNLSAYAKLYYHNIWDGIDLMLFGNDEGLKFHWLVAPGADPSLIRLHYDGVENLSLNKNGDLVITHALGTISEPAPIAWQDNEDVACRFFLDTENHEYGFLLGEYSAEKQLTIDPFMIYSTFLGGTSGDSIEGISADSSGNAYVTGYTTSTNFPVTPGAFQTVYDSSTAAFISKFSPNGKTLIFSTFISGDTIGRVTRAFALAVNDSGNAFITGNTNDPNFPTTPGAFQYGLSTHGGAFVLKLAEDGSSLVYSAAMRGNGTGNSGTVICLDNDENPYIAGTTTASNLPASSGAFQTALYNNNPGFVAKFSANGENLIYCTYLGGVNVLIAETMINGIGLNTQGDVYVNGYTTAEDFPTTIGAYQTTRPLNYTVGFVTKLSPELSSLIYSTFLTGSLGSVCDGIKIDANDYAYVTGVTTSSDFPVTIDAFQTVLQEGASCFVSKISPDGSALEYSSFLGGLSEGTGITIDQQGRAYVVGNTTSPNFPITPTLYPSEYIGPSVFVTVFSADGSSLELSVLFSCTGPSSISTCLVLGPGGNVFVAGRTSCSDFPVTAGAYQTLFGGGDNDGFIIRFQVDPLNIIINRASLTCIRVS